MADRMENFLINDFLKTYFIHQDKTMLKIAKLSCKVAPNQQDTLYGV